MVSPYLFVGAEDLDFTWVGQSIAIDTSASHFRAGYARYGLSIPPGSSYVITPTAWFASGSFWTTARLWNSVAFYQFPNGNVLFRAHDAAGVLRLQIIGASGVWSVQKVNSVGTATPLFTFAYPFLNGPTFPDKLDIFINYAVSGTVTVYNTQAGTTTQLGTFSGDVTTDGVTSLGSVGFGHSIDGQFSDHGTTSWSEVIVSTQDTRLSSLITFAPVANGVNSNWTGVVGNVNPNLYNDAVINTVAAANLVQEYTIGSFPAGTFYIATVVPTARVARGATGPQNLQMVTRTAAADFVSATQALALAPGRVSVPFDLNPNTGVAWTEADLAAAGFNFGLKSIT